MAAGFPFEVETVAGADALARRETLAASRRGYPVITGSADDLDLLREQYASSSESKDELVDAAERIDVERWLAERAAEEDDDYYAAYSGAWPRGAEPTSTFTGHTDLASGGLLDTVTIALLPAEASWQAPCVLRYGGWNVCPGPEEHAALLRRWEERYGARLVTMRFDTLELAVERPPSKRRHALRLARDQFAYCPDIVQQGVGTVEALAASLLDAPVWFFWWD